MQLLACKYLYNKLINNYNSKFHIKDIKLLKTILSEHAELIFC